MPRIYQKKFKSGKCYITRRGDQHNTRFFVFGVFAYKHVLGRTEMRTRERKEWQSTRTVWDISRDDRARSAVCRLRTKTDEFRKILTDIYIIYIYIYLIYTGIYYVYTVEPAFNDLSDKRPPAVYGHFTNVPIYINVNVPRSADTCLTRTRTVINWLSAPVITDNVNKHHIFWWLQPCISRPNRGRPCVQCLLSGLL